jgi:hypothetical protein
LIAEGTAVGTEGIVQAVRLEGASGSERIGSGIRIERIRAQLAEIFRVDGERQWQQQEQKEEDNPHRDPPGKGTTIAFSLQRYGMKKARKKGIVTEPDVEKLVFQGR